jgi:hypothetical protein
MAVLVFLPRSAGTKIVTADLPRVEGFLGSVEARPHLACLSYPAAAAVTEWQRRHQRAVEFDYFRTTGELVRYNCDVVLREDQSLTEASRQAEIVAIAERAPEMTMMTTVWSVNRVLSWAWDVAD